MKNLLLILAILLVTLVGCTDAQRGKITSLGDSAKIECYSGGLLIYSGLSTGKISSESNSDGYYFRDSKTDKMMEVSGNCVITYNP